jgi:hypothetical protein
VLTAIRAWKMHPVSRPLERNLAMRNPGGRNMTRCFRMTWRNLTRPGMDIALAALCAIDFWWERVTARVEDTTFDSFDILPFYSGRTTA